MVEMFKNMTCLQVAILLVETVMENSRSNVEATRSQIPSIGFLTDLFRDRIFLYLIINCFYKIRTTFATVLKLPNYF